MAGAKADVLREGLTARLDLAPDADDDEILAAFDARIAQVAIGDTEPVELEQRTIRHSLFAYDLPGGGNAVAFRGQTVPLMPHDVQKGEKLGAFTAHVGDESDSVANSTLPPLKPDASDEDADAWVVSGSVSDIMDAVSSAPETAAAVLAAEERRKGSARKTLLEGLARVVGER